jgi:hypothetical protein
MVHITIRTLSKDQTTTLDIQGVSCIFEHILYLLKKVNRVNGKRGIETLYQTLITDRYTCNEREVDKNYAVIIDLHREAFIMLWKGVEKVEVNLQKIFQSTPEELTFSLYQQYMTIPIQTN